MSRILAFDLNSSGSQTILVEAAVEELPQGQMPVALSGFTAEKASEAFDTVLAGVRPIAASVLAAVRDSVEDASEIQVEFGIKLTASAGLILANAASEGHCKVLLKWVRSSGK